MLGMKNSKLLINQISKKTEGALSPEVDEAGFFHRRDPFEDHSDYI